MKLDYLHLFCLQITQGNFEDYHKENINSAYHKLNMFSALFICVKLNDQ